MNTLASNSGWSSTPVGAVLLVLLVAVLGVIGYFYRRAESRRSAEAAEIRTQIGKLESALTVNTQALALIVQRSADDRPRLEKVDTLDKAVAVLTDRMNRHEQWAGQQERSTPARRREPR